MLEGCQVRPSGGSPGESLINGDTRPDLEWAPQCQLCGTDCDLVGGPRACEMWDYGPDDNSNQADLDARV